MVCVCMIIWYIGGVPTAKTADSFLQRQKERENKCQLHAFFLYQMLTSQSCGYVVSLLKQKWIGWRMFLFSSVNMVA